MLGIEDFEDLSFGEFMFIVLLALIVALGFGLLISIAVDNHIAKIMSGGVIMEKYIDSNTPNLVVKLGDNVKIVEVKLEQYVLLNVGDTFYKED